MSRLNATVMVNAAKEKMRSRLAGKDSAPGELYVERVCLGISRAVDEWQKAAKIRNIKINGPVAKSTEMAALWSVDLAFLLCWSDTSGTLPRSTDWEYKMSLTIARALGLRWGRWLESIYVQGLPWYPSFAHLRAPMAPPTPNVATPLAGLAQDFTQLTHFNLEREIYYQRSLISRASSLGPVNVGLWDVADSVATGFVAAFPNWRATVMVAGVLGTGPVPSYSPPLFMGGPVVDGETIPSPTSNLPF